MINTELDFPLTNGEIVKLTLNFQLLLKLKCNYKEEYDKFNDYVVSGNRDNKDFFDVITIIYVAYLCANFDSKNKYPKEEFVKLIPLNMDLIMKTQNELLGIKKK